MKGRVELHCHTTMSSMDGVGEGVFIVIGTLVALWFDITFFRVSISLLR